MRVMPDHQWPTPGGKQLEYPKELISRKPRALFNMMIRNRCLAIAACCLLACCMDAAPANADCADLVDQLDAAMTFRKLTDVGDLDARIARDGSCGEPDISKAHRSKAMLQFDLVKSMIKQGKASEAEGLLMQASNVLWDAAAALGNMKSAQRKFVEATLAYDRAIELIKNGSFTPAAPGKETIQAIFNSASETRLLAANEEGSSGATYVAAVKDHRDGTVGGTMSENIRGLTPTSVAIPIGFETASARFSEVGRRAANEFLLALQQQHPAKITLVGHTDERGEASYNMRLSEERVKAVAAFLKQNGIAAQIITVAKGKTEPLQLSDTSQYNREDLWALNRRVEWKRQ